MILGPGTGKQLNARKHLNRPKSLGVLGLGSACAAAGLQPGVCTPVLPSTRVLVGPVHRSSDRAVQTGKSTSMGSIRGTSQVKSF